MTQAFNLAQLANNLDSSGRLDATDGLVNAVPVANGGTGASSVAAAVSNLSASIYPVGSIYINAGVTTNPATLLGFGTWTAFGAGRVMVGLNAGDSAFDTLQETGGSKDAIVVSHSHSATSSVSDPGHSHRIDFGASFAGASFVQPTVNDIGQNINTAGATTGISVSTSIGSTGSSATNANLQPYITVCMWLRTA
jgi:microcystin-dependent protein